MIIAITALLLMAILLHSGSYLPEVARDCDAQLYALAPKPMI